jgi:peptidoglycan pentaglycine glycine transferase (the first glycine)
MNTKVITEADRIKWNEFVSASDGSILQSYEWGELKAKFGWKPLRIALEDPSTHSVRSGHGFVAGASILIKQLPIFKRPVFYIPQGPVVDFKDSKTLNALLSEIKRIAREHGAVSLKIDPPIEEGPEVEKILRFIGFIRNKKQIQPRATYYIDLNLPTDKLMASFEEKTRYNIRLSEKKGVTVQEVNTDKGIADFYCLYEQTAKRDEFLIHPYSYYSNIKELLIDRGLASLFIAYYKDRPVAGVFIFKFGRRIWYMYGASSSEARNVMPNHGLHWHVIKWAKEKGYTLYDLWGIPANPNEKHPLWGVYRFKKGFNGRLVKYVGAYDLPFDRLMYFVFEKGAVLLKNTISLLKKGRIEDSLGE